MRASDGPTSARRSAYIAHVLVRRGSTAEAAILVEEFVPLARDARDAHVLVPALAAAALVEQARGDLSAAAGFVEEIEQSRLKGIRISPPGHASLDELAAGAPSKPKIWISVRRLLDSIRSDGRPCRSLACRSSRRTGRGGPRIPEAALLLFEEAEKRWGEYGFVFGRGLALLGSARCLLALGRTDRRDTGVAQGARHPVAPGSGARRGVDALLGDQPAAARAAK